MQNNSMKLTIKSKSAFFMECCIIYYKLFNCAHNYPESSQDDGSWQRPGRSHGGDLASDTRGTTDRDKANGSGDLGKAEEPMSPSDTDGSGDLGRAAAKSIRGGASVPED